MNDDLPHEVQFQ